MSFPTQVESKKLPVRGPDKPEDELFAPGRTDTILKNDDAGDGAKDTRQYIQHVMMTAVDGGKPDTEQDTAVQ